MTYTFSNDCYSDLYKDVYGFRPSSDNYRWWVSLSDDEKQVEWNHLCEALEQTVEAEKELERHYHVDFEMKISKLMGSGAATRKQAVQWLYDSIDDPYDYDYADWHFGLKYGTFRSELA